MGNCKHDYDNAVRKGRVHYICPKCEEDVTMELLFMYQLEQESKRSDYSNETEEGRGRTYTTVIRQKTSHNL